MNEWQTAIRDIAKTDKKAVQQFAKALAPAMAAYLKANMGKYPTVLEAIVTIDKLTDETAQCMRDQDNPKQVSDNTRAANDLLHQVREIISTLMYDRAEDFWAAVAGEIGDSLTDECEVADILCDDSELIKAVK